MSIEHILSGVRNFAGIFELAPEPGSEHPEVSWGDSFFYFAPDGRLPLDRQPYATIVTKDYPDDVMSRLDIADRRRSNIHAGSVVFTHLLGYRPDEIDGSSVDYSVTDTWLPHPLYGAYGWVCVVNPARTTTARALDVLRVAHLADRRRAERRGGGS